MSSELKYEDVEKYLRTFTGGKPALDFGALLRLVLAGVENLRQNGAEEDIVQNAHAITDAQAAFIKRLLDGRFDSIEWFKDDVGHSSRTGQL